MRRMVRRLMGRTDYVWPTSDRQRPLRGAAGYGLMNRNVSQASLTERAAGVTGS